MTLGTLAEMDVATRQQQLMAVVQKDPAKATEIMQAIQSLGTAEVQAASLEPNKEKLSSTPSTRSRSPTTGPTSPVS